MTKEVLANLITAKVAEIQTVDVNLFDPLTMSDLDKAYRQFSANVDRAIADAVRRADFNKEFNNNA